MTAASTLLELCIDTMALFWRELDADCVIHQLVREPISLSLSTSWMDAGKLCAMGNYCYNITGISLRLCGEVLSDPEA